MATRLTVGGAVLLLAAGSALPALAATPDEVIEEINAELRDGIAEIEDVVADFNEDLADADSLAEADELRLDARSDVQKEWGITRDEMSNLAWEYHPTSAVGLALNLGLGVLQDARHQALAEINELHAAWEAANATTTTTTNTTTPLSSTTTTTARPSTTTTAPVAPPTTTTTPLAGLLPDLPEGPGSNFTGAMPEAVVVSSATLDAEAGSDQAMAVVGFVTRVVESRLPAGVSDIAVGPLVVFGLVLDAVRAAGLFMMIPWVLLIGYMAVLLLAGNDWRSRLQRAEVKA